MCVSTPINRFFTSETKAKMREIGKENTLKNENDRVGLYHHGYPRLPTFDNTSNSDNKSSENIGLTSHAATV